MHAAVFVCLLLAEMATWVLVARVQVDNAARGADIPWRMSSGRAVRKCIVTFVRNSLAASHLQSHTTQVTPKAQSCMRLGRPWTANSTVEFGGEGMFRVTLL